MRTLTFALFVGLVCTGAALAQQERAISLKDAPGRAVVQTNCGSCHSLDYVVMNSPFLDRAGWDAAVTKMIKAYGAPISADDAKTITDYLASNYGRK